VKWLAAALAVTAAAAVARAEGHRTIAGSLQLDYLMVPTNWDIRGNTLDGLTTELSLKMSIDFTASASASVKLCFACHGFEAAAAFVDLRASDGLTVRIGRLTPEFGSFPQRGDPANHRTNDKPLPYDMGRMLRVTDWNAGVLPAPWVDNGVELMGTRFVSGGRIDYAAYILSGPKSATGEAEPADFTLAESRDPSKYYVDNNSEPVIGARLAGTADLDSDGHTLTLGASVMAGHYDPARQLAFWILGGDAVANLSGLVLRAEYLVRNTDVAIGADPAARWKEGPDAGGRYLDHFTKHGFYLEAEVPVGRVDAFARFDGLLRFGNVVKASVLTPRASVLRYTAGAALRLSDNLRLKASAELYQFDDLADELALQFGVATPF
jgi:hypothetical protein